MIFSRNFETVSADSHCTWHGKSAYYYSTTLGRDKKDIKLDKLESKSFHCQLSNILTGLVMLIVVKWESAPIIVRVVVDSGYFLFVWQVTDHCSHFLMACFTVCNKNKNNCWRESKLYPVFVSRLVSTVTLACCKVYLSNCCISAKLTLYI